MIKWIKIFFIKRKIRKMDKFIEIGNELINTPIPIGISASHLSMMKLVIDDTKQKVDILIKLREDRYKHLFFLKAMEK